MLFYLPERLAGYDPNKTDIIQRVIPPVSVALCPTSRCVRSCTFCSNAQRNKVNSRTNAGYSDKSFSDIVEDMKSLGVRGVSVAGGGEPLAYEG